MAVPVPRISCCVLNHHNLFYQIQNGLAFNWDTCCHLALCLWLLLTFTPRNFFTTPAAVAAFVNLAIAETNQGYANTQIPITLALHCIADSSIAANNSFGVMITNFLVSASMLIFITFKNSSQKSATVFTKKLKFKIKKLLNLLAKLS
jgi:hypothetical protein